MPTLHRKARRVLDASAAIDAIAHVTYDHLVALLEEMVVGGPPDYIDASSRQEWHYWVEQLRKELDRLSAGSADDLSVRYWATTVGDAVTSDRPTEGTVGAFKALLERSPESFNVDIETRTQSYVDLALELEVSWSLAGDVDYTVKMGHSTRAEALSEAVGDALEALAAPPPAADSPVTPVVFLGHGNDRQWMEVRDALMQAGVEVLHFEGVPNAGETIQSVVDNYLERATIGVFLYTGEDETASGGVRARQNVVHETGLFQGRHGWNRALLLVEDGVEVPTNLSGIVQLRFPANRIDALQHKLIERVKLM